MDVYSNIRYFRSLPPTNDLKFEPYTEGKNTFVMKSSQRVNHAMHPTYTILLSNNEQEDEARGAERIQIREHPESEV
jgi:hypothetical protein